jgi:signal peptidase II
MTRLFRGTTGRALLVVIALTTIGCDRVTKQIAATSLAGLTGQSYLADTVRLSYAENSGAFLSLGAGLPHAARVLLFIAVTGTTLTVLVVLAWHHRWKGWLAVGVTLFVAGGVSNWIDRATSGYVVDFLNVGIGPLRTGIFNVADVAILIGAVVAVAAEWKGKSKEVR